MLKIESDLAGLLGPKGWIPAGGSRAFSRDWLDRYGETPLGIARPTTTAEVSSVVAECRNSGVAVVPQGGNTSLCGGGVAGAPNTVILSLSGMAAIDNPDVASGSVTVEAGAVLANLHTALEAHRLIFPLHLGAEGSAQIGGLIGTNAGGSHALRYGLMQDLVLGLEVVLPDGVIWNGLRAVRKDNAGYQLRKLFCGAEGTLGIVTRAVLQLHPAPRQKATALIALPGWAAAVQFGMYLRGEASEFMSGLEFFCDLALGLALKNLSGLTFPLGSRDAVYLLVELAASSLRVPLEEILSGALEWGMEQALVSDGALAMTEAQRAHFWRLREELPEAQRLEGAQLKHDISVPPGHLADFIAQGAALCNQLLPNVRINPFGHLGDGNIHYNLSPPDGDVDFRGRELELGQALAALATSMNGSFAAEHGLGRAKIPLADKNRSASERALMARVKQALDPEGLMNPGVILERIYRP